MRDLSSLKRPLLRVLALIFVLALVAYSAIWMYYIRWQPKAELGISSPPYPPMTNYFTVGKVSPLSPADKAGFLPGDRIIRANGHPVHSLSYPPSVMRGNPGDVVLFEVLRSGATTPITLTATLAPAKEPSPRPWDEAVALELADSFPVLFVMVAVPVLFLRFEDRNAWLLAFVFAGFCAAAPLSFLEGAMHPAFRGFALAYMIALYGTAPALFYFFCAVFPNPSPLDRLLPYLKYALVGITGAVSLCLATAVFLRGSLSPAISASQAWMVFPPMTILYLFSGFALGLVSLVWNSMSATDPRARRKTRVMVWGTVAAFTPGMLLTALGLLTKRSFYDFPFWVWITPIITLSLMPLAFAYAVLKHRVLEVPVLLKRSARYFLAQRGFILLIIGIGAAATIVLAHQLEHRFWGPVSGVPLGVVFGVVFVWAGTQVESRVTRRLDRAFFRSAYDARLILEDLSAKSRSAESQQTLAALLRQHIHDAMHPSWLGIYFSDSSRLLIPTDDAAPTKALGLPASLPWLVSLASLGVPQEVAPDSPNDDVRQSFAPLPPDCLVPILRRDGEMVGLIVLGPRLSEEPYSREDKRLLQSVANQAGVALENMRFAEEMAARIETERRATQEMEIARQVQSRLLPQHAPRLSTLACAGKCIQTRAVGGDYFDFLDFGSGRLGLVVADISGKGMSGALLMANLQANLRSQYALALEDVSLLLRSVNQLFYQNTEVSNYATMFFAVYRDEDRTLSYVNCGHNPPILLRATGEIERLRATATVLGLFGKWDCSVATLTLTDDDVLVIYTDGISEASLDDDHEFGDASLIEVIRAHQHESPVDLLQAIVTEVQNFSRGVQADDMTLIVARCISQDA